MSDPRKLLETLQAFINADTWAESRRILDDHPELLSDEADALLAHLVEAARAQGDERARRVLEQHRDLLRRCREVGVEAAFADLVGAKRAAPPIPPEFREDLRRAQEGEQRHQQMGDLAALNAAVAAWERILHHPAFEGADERFRLAAMNDAGGAFFRRFEATGDLEDLKTATALWQQAIARTPEGSPDWASMQANLGVALRTRFEALGAVADLDAAIEAFQKALGVARQGSPDWAMYQNNLGLALSTRFEALEEVADLDAAIEAVQKALPVFSPETFPEYTLRAALPLGRLLMRRQKEEDLEHLAAAYAKAAPAWHHLYFESLHEGRRQRQLRRAQEMWAAYAYALNALGRPRRAVEVLEMGRARQLAEALRSREVLDKLREPALAEARRAVKEAESRYHHASEKDRPAAERALADRRRAWYALLREHFPDFFAEPTFADVQAAAADAPLVYLLATPAGGLALIVHADGAGRGGASPGPYTPAVTPIWLEGLTEAELNARVEGPGRRWGGYLGAYFRWVRSLRPQTPARERYRARDGWMRALSSTARWLGQVVMAPLVEALTPSPAADPASPSPRVRGGGGEEVRPITLIPTGRLALLPLHAARLPDGTDVLDHLAVAYAPSAQALRAARRAAARAGRPRRPPRHAAGRGRPRRHPPLLRPGGAGRPRPARLAAHHPPAARRGRPAGRRGGPRGPRRLVLLGPRPGRVDPPPRERHHPRRRPLDGPPPPGVLGPPQGHQGRPGRALRLRGGRARAEAARGGHRPAGHLPPGRRRRRSRHPLEREPNQHRPPHGPLLGALAGRRPPAASGPPGGPALASEQHLAGVAGPPGTLRGDGPQPGGGRDHETPLARNGALLRAPAPGGGRGEPPLRPPLLLGGLHVHGPLG